MFVILL
jgi:ATP citrate (pro-S)-lyase